MNWTTLWTSMVCGCGCILCIVYHCVCVFVSVCTSTCACEFGLQTCSYIGAGLITKVYTVGIRICKREAIHNSSWQYMQSIHVPIPTFHSHYHSSSVFMYDCASEELSRACSECALLPQELSCGYCTGPMECLHSSLCNTPAVGSFIASTQDTGQCPVSIKVSQNYILCHSLSI